MAALKAFFWVLCIVVCLVSLAQARQLAESRNDEDDIPQRCVENSVTAVSCEGVSEDELMPHPDDCHLFYYCVGPEHAPLCRECPADLHFSPTEHVCDRPDHAGCQQHSLPCQLTPS